MGGQSENGGKASFDFDMEWAYYTLMDDPNMGNVERNAQLKAATNNTQAASDAAQTAIQATKSESGGRKRKIENGEEGPEEQKKAKGKAIWRKYGQKTLKGKDYTGMKMLRCYYRCNHPGCQVKKQVETSAWSNEAANITIHGIHNHPVEEPREEDKPIQREGVSVDQQVTSNNRIAEPKPTPPL